MWLSTRLKYWYWAHFSHPKSDRALYRLLRSKPLASIVEIGIGDASRAKRLLAVAGLLHPEVKVRYTGIDLFEARGDGQPGLALREAHRRLAGTGAKVQLVPGDPLLALMRVANSLAGTDWVMISADVEGDSLEKGLRFLPRMLTPVSLLLWEVRDGAGNVSGYRQSNLAELEAQLARKPRADRKAA